MSRYAIETSPGVWVRERPGRTAIKLSDGAELGPDPDIGWTDDLAALCGYFPIVTVAQPADTATTTWDRTLGDVAGSPSDVWTERNKTQPELDAETQQTQDDADLSAWVALKPDYITGRDLPNLGGGNLSNAELSDAIREHRQLLRKLCRGQLRLMRQYE